MVRKTVADFARLGQEVARLYPGKAEEAKVRIEEDGNGQEDLVRKQRYLEGYLKELMQMEEVRGLRAFREFLGIGGAEQSDI